MIRSSTIQRERSGLPGALGRYRLYDKIGAGGMATIHLARRMGAQDFRRTVAIKRLHPYLARDPEFVAGLIDEAWLTARIHHPNVVATLDMVATNDDPFIVMDYVHGESLARLARLAALRGENVPPRIAASIVASALHGLHAAHEAKGSDGEDLTIVHRDVSPQNILVGADGVARVIDFGIATAIGQAHTTPPCTIKGKLGYMAPEQLAGRVTRAIDIYAAAVVLWELITGEPLFRGVDNAETILNVLTRVPEAPSAFVADDGEIDPTLRVLDEIVLRGLAREPDDRFASARDMALSLEAFGVATSADVADWVLRVAGPELEARASLVSRVESYSTHGQSVAELRPA